MGFGFLHRVVIVSSGSPEAELLGVSASEAVGGNDGDRVGVGRGSGRKVEVGGAGALCMREPYAGAAQRVEAGRIVGVGDVDALHGAAVAAVLIPDHRPVRVPVPRLDHQSVTIALDLTREPETQLPVGRFVEALVLPLEVVARLAEELIALRRAVGIHRVVPEVAAELRHVVLRE